MGLKWERINSNKHWCYRAKVPGGWLVYIEHDDGGGTGLTFYPDPDGRWALGRRASVVQSTERIGVVDG